MMRLLLVLVVVLSGAAARAQEKDDAKTNDAPPRVVDVKPGESYIAGILVVPRSDKRIEAPPAPESVAVFGGSGGSIGGFDKRSFVSPKKLTAKDYHAKKPLGVSVYDVKPDESPLAKVVKPGDVLGRINGRLVGTPREFASAINGAKGKYTVAIHRFDYSSGWFYGTFDSTNGRIASWIYPAKIK
jgi:hypothetical protein